MIHEMIKRGTGKFVIEEKEIVLYGKQYMDAILEDGEEILYRWDYPSNMWVILRFTNDEELSKLSVERLIECAIEYL